MNRTLDPNELRTRLLQLGVVAMGLATSGIGIAQEHHDAEDGDPPSALLYLYLYP